MDNNADSKAQQMQKEMKKRPKMKMQQKRRKKEADALLKYGRVREMWTAWSVSVGESGGFCPIVDHLPARAWLSSIPTVITPYCLREVPT